MKDSYLKQLLMARSFIFWHKGTGILLDAFVFCRGGEGKGGRMTFLHCFHSAEGTRESSSE